MSGRPKIKVYEYQKDGKFVKAYDCINDARREYWPNDRGQRPLFKNGTYVYDFVKLPNGNILLQNRMYRDHIKKMIKRSESPWIDESNDNRYIQVLNMDGEQIATFKNIRIAGKMTNISDKTIYQSLNNNKGCIGKNGLLFKYKNINE